VKQLMTPLSLSLSNDSVDLTGSPILVDRWCTPTWFSLYSINYFFRF